MRKRAMYPELLGIISEGVGMEGTLIQGIMMPEKYE